jgi:hypothetical protein
MFLGADRHIHELSVHPGQNWQYTDLTTNAGVPPAPATSEIVGYAWETGGSKQAVFTTDDGHVHELYKRTTGSWKSADLTSITSCSPVHSG